METVRTFIGLFPPPEIQQVIADACASARQEKSSLRWEATHKLHVTLKFLGDIAAEKIPPLKSALEYALSDSVAASVSLQRFGFFPNEREPRIVWVGPDIGENEAVSVLAARIEEACAAAGFERERHPFRPHITVARVKNRISPALITMIENATLHELKFDSNIVAVMRSDLQPVGSLYTTQFTIPLKSQEQQ
jgi:2'-5' RNA ligase